MINMKKIIASLLVLVFLAVMTGCSSKTGSVDKSKDGTAAKTTEKQKTQVELDSEVVVKVIQDNITATNNKDVEEYLKGVAPELREETKTYIEKLFASVEFSTSAKDINVTNISDKEATVKFTQITKYGAGTIDKNGQPVTEASIKITDTLKKIDGTWYIASTTVDEKK